MRAEAGGQARLVVVGGGIAGWTAARRAQRAGAHVTLVERSEDALGAGNTLLSGGVFHAAYLDPLRRTPRELSRTLAARSERAESTELIHAWAANVRSALTFLEAEGGAHGVSFQARGEREYEARTLAPFNSHARDLIGSGAWEGKGPHRLLESMRENFVSAEGIFLGGTRATSLLEDRAIVVGIRAEDASGAERELSADAVILADGGFQANAELVRRHITSFYRVRGSAYDTGDALQMGLRVGAATANMQNFYGHALVRDAVANDRLWPWPNPEPLIDHGIVVDGYGRRIADEGRGDADHSEVVDAVSGPIAWSRTPERCWVIFDQQAWATAGRSPRCGLDPVLAEERGTMVIADSTERLAKEMQVAVEALEVTIDSFNRFCNGDGDLSPQRSGPVRALVPPLYAIPLVAGITFTMGGLLVNQHGQVLREDTMPIRGLYASGGTMAGLQGGPNNSRYAGGWSEAATFGLLAGRHAARSAQPR